MTDQQNTESILSEENLEFLQNLKQKGASKIEIDYYGGGDEGTISNIYCKELNDEILKYGKDFIDLGFYLLEAKFPGWEINEGSEGTIYIDLSKEIPKIKINHGTYTIQFEEEEIK